MTGRKWVGRLIVESAPPKPEQRCAWPVCIISLHKLCTRRDLARRHFSLEARRGLLSHFFLTQHTVLPIASSSPSTARLAYPLPNLPSLSDCIATSKRNVIVLGVHSDVTSPETRVKRARFRRHGRYRRRSPRSRWRRLRGRGFYQRESKPVRVVAASKEGPCEEGKTESEER